MAGCIYQVAVLPVGVCCFRLYFLKWKKTWSVLRLMKPVERYRWFIGIIRISRKVPLSNTFREWFIVKTNSKGKRPQDATTDIIHRRLLDPAEKNGICEARIVLESKEWNVMICNFIAPIPFSQICVCWPHSLALVRTPLWARLRLAEFWDKQRKYQLFFYQVKPLSRFDQNFPSDLWSFNKDHGLFVIQIYVHIQYGIGPAHQRTQFYPTDFLFPTERITERNEGGIMSHSMFGMDEMEILKTSYGFRTQLPDRLFIDCQC